MPPTKMGFDLRRDHGFRNPPVLPPFVSLPVALQSAKAHGEDRERAFRFRRPPADIWSSHPYDYRSVRQQQQQQQQQQRPPQVGEDSKGRALEAHGTDDDVGTNPAGFDAGGSDDPQTPEKSLAGPGDGVMDGGGAKEELGIGVEEVLSGPRAFGSGELVGWGEDDEERVEGGDDDEEEEWVMSPEWAEHFRNSPSVQRYLQRVQASKGKAKSGGTSKQKTKNAATRGNKKIAGAGKGATSPHAGGSTKHNKSRAAASASAAADATSDERAAVKGQEAAKAADDAKKMELELAKIRARALLYAEKQQDRDLEDAIIIPA